MLNLKLYCNILKTISYNFILIQIPIQGNVYAKNPGPFHKFGET